MHGLRAVALGVALGVAGVCEGIVVAAGAMDDSGTAPSTATGCEGSPIPTSLVYVCDTFPRSGGIGADCDGEYEQGTECTEASCTCAKTEGDQTLQTCTCQPTGPDVCIGQPKSRRPFAL
jgi:hypothetical protein